MNGAGVRIEWDSRELTTALDRLTQRQLPFAIAVALTRTGQVIKNAEISEMRRVFDRPTPFTLNSLMLRPATKQRQYAEVWFKDFAPKGTPAAKYLLPQVRGGSRSNKRFEGALRHGGVLGRDEYAIPARGAPKDSYGNVRRGLYQRILSDLGSSRDASQNSKGSGKFFVGTIGRVRHQQKPEDDVHLHTRSGIPEPVCILRGRRARPVSDLRTRIHQGHGSRSRDRALGSGLSKLRCPFWRENRRARAALHDREMGVSES